MVQVWIRVQETIGFFPTRHGSPNSIAMDGAQSAVIVWKKWTPVVAQLVGGLNPSEKY